MPDPLTSESQAAAPSPLAAALGKIPSGLFILTAAHDGAATGMLASWVMQAGFEPPMVTVAVNKKRYLCDWLAAESTRFALHVVPQGDTTLLKHFGRGFEPDADAFAGLDVAGEFGSAPLLPQADARLHCEVRGSLDAGDHRLFLAEVVAGDASSDGAPAVHLRKNGLNY